MSQSSLQRALRIWRDSGNVQGQGQAHYGLAKTRHFAGQTDIALSHLRAALSLQRAIGDDRMAALALLWTGKIHAEGPEPGAALEPLHEAHSMFTHMTDRHGEAESATALADVHLRLGAPTAASTWLGRAQALLADHPDALTTGMFHHASRNLAVALGDRERAARHQRLALESYHSAACIESRRMLARLDEPGLEHP